MTDAERLMRDFVPSLAASPFRIAAESVDELVKIMGVEPWLLEIGPGRANFTACQDKQEITGTYAAMLSLWAVSASVLAMTEISDAAFAANLVIEQGGPGSKVVEFQHLAVGLLICAMD
ncbi:hypothetical protein LQT97_11980 [Brucella pseudogrignonensis]|uniref:hypothetical protein n=1 Tax=Brucella pseudogrignonensis TaxID=419475 RepID=UPI001E33C705|nr:hypothetical protein [Brucella pseudogrignonensis]MCD4511954.1 hypothetical protein [Brucella pseudogrignonensis]